MTPLAGPLRHALGPAYVPVRDFVWSIFSITERTGPVWIASYVALAYLVWLREARRTQPREGFWRYLFPKAVYAHPSARADYVYFVVDKVLMAAALGTLAVSSRAVMEKLLAVFPARQQPASSWASAVVTLVAFVAFDFASFFWHFLTHRVPLLWAFHRVHHAVEVLTPISNYREHPVDSLGRSIFEGTVVGVALAVLAHLVPGGRPVEIWSINVVYLPSFVFANARHSHVWLSFGRFWDRIVSSPALHQIHHGSAPRHIDVNYGLVFSFWDALFGTLYVPERREEVRYGLVGEARPFPTIASMYFRPFADALQALRGHPIQKLSSPQPS